MLESVHGGSAAKAGHDATPSEALDLFGGALMEAAGEAREALAVEDPVKAVHELRKAFKRLRGLLRLVRRETGGRAAAGEARTLRRRLGDAARLLSGARDIAARREALEDLAAKELISAALLKQATRVLVPRSSRGQQAGLAPHREELEGLIAASESAAMHLAGGMGRAKLLRAVTREYAEARRQVEKVDPADPETLHELRKAVVAHRYQMTLITDGWPAIGRAWESELQRLREKLGKFQDLSVLLERLGQPSSEEEPSPEWQAELMEAARARQMHLTATALRLHARLFAEKPKAFARRLSAYFDPVSDRE